MLINNELNLEDTLLVYKSLDANPPHWILCDTSDEPEPMSARFVEAGRIVLSVLNQINPIKYSRDDEAEALLDEIIFGYTNTLKYDHKFHEDIGYFENGKEDEYSPEREQGHVDNSMDDDEFFALNRDISEWVKYYKILVGIIAKREAFKPQTLYKIFNFLKILLIVLSIINHSM